MDVTFRRATNRDRAAAARVVDEALREYGLHVLPDSSDVDLTDLEAHYDARGGRFELLEGADGEALGVLGWRPAGDPRDGVVELKKLYLAPAARGRGLGRRALERAVGAAQAAGARAVGYCWRIRLPCSGLRRMQGEARGRVPPATEFANSVRSCSRRPRCWARRTGSTRAAASCPSGAPTPRRSPRSRTSATSPTASTSRRPCVAAPRPTTRARPTLPPGA